MFLLHLHPIATLWRHAIALIQQISVNYSLSVNAQAPQMPEILIEKRGSRKEDVYPLLVLTVWHPEAKSGCCISQEFSLLMFRLPAAFCSIFSRTHLNYCADGKVVFTKCKSSASVVTINVKAKNLSHFVW